jgi:hypothetical protein
MSVAVSVAELLPLLSSSFAAILPSNPLENRSRVISDILGNDSLDQFDSVRARAQVAQQTSEGVRSSSRGFFFFHRTTIEVRATLETSSALAECDMTSAAQS